MLKSAENCVKSQAIQKVRSDASRRRHGNAAQPQHLCFAICELSFYKRFFCAEFTVSQLLIFVLTVVCGNEQQLSLCGTSVTEPRRS